MRVWAFDPGAVATGVALYEQPMVGFPEADFGWMAKQFTDPADAMAAFLDEHDRDDYVLVEDYRSGGHLTKEAKATIKIVGYFENTFLADPWVRLEMRWEQQRLSGNTEADRLMKAAGIKNPSDANHKDARAALAHCITFARQFSPTGRRLK
jgi:hypothetical protein